MALSNYFFSFKICIDSLLLDISFYHFINYFLIFLKISYGYVLFVLGNNKIKNN